MKPILLKIQSEPLMTVAIVVAAILAVLIQTGTITISDINEFIATFGTVLGIVLAALGLRKLVAPATGVAGAVRENQVIADTLERVRTGEIPPEMYQPPEGGA